MYAKVRKDRRLSIGIINSDLLCVLCSGYLVDATTITECLHRFCRSCIVKYLKNTQFCPICDVQINQNRPWESLRPDTTIQTLVYKIVPGLYQKEMARRRAFYAKSDAAPSSPEDGGELPAGQLFYSQEDSISLSLEYYNEDNEEDSNETEAPKRYLKCPAAVTVRHLKKFLRMKLAISSNFGVDIIYEGECLPEGFSLMDVAYTFKWKRTSPMRFSYRFQVQKIPKSLEVNSRLTVAFSPKSEKNNLDDQQKQSEYLGHLNLNPATPVSGSKHNSSQESDSNSSELFIESERETAIENEEERRRKLKKERKFKRNGEKRHSFMDNEPQDRKKRRKEDSEHLKSEALRKVFKEKADVKKKEEDGRRKKRKKSKHYDGEVKRKKDIAPPAILSVAKDALKLKVKLAPVRPIEDDEAKATKERLLHLRAVRHKPTPSKEIISSSPSLTISKIGGEPPAQKSTLIESKPSLEIMLVKKKEDAPGESVLDLSDKTTRKEVEIISPKKNTQQSILQIAETLVNRKLTPAPANEMKESPVAVVAMRDLKTLSDAAVNILMAAKNQTEPPKRAESQLKIPVFPRDRPNPIPPVPNLHEIYPRGRGRPLSNGPRPPPLIKPGQNQIVRQIPDPFVILNRKNLMSIAAENDEKPKIDDNKPAVPKLFKMTNDTINNNNNNNNNLKAISTAKAIVKLSPPLTGVRKIESVAAGLTARANAALIDAK